MPELLLNVTNMLIDHQVFEKARRSRDPRFDGHFFVAVRTTGIYCRPICRVKLPKSENVTFFQTAAAAAEAGYRPCLRCRPEAAPGTPAWRGTSTTVSRALRLISAGALDGQNVPQLCHRLGVTDRHLCRLFRDHLGTSPGAVAQTRRLQFAKKLIDESSLSMIEVAMAAGYGSVRRFNDHVKKIYGRAPGTLRKHSVASETGGLLIRLPYREPFDFNALLAFFAARAIPSVEQVTGAYFYYGWRR